MEFDVHVNKLKVITVEAIVDSSQQRNRFFYMFFFRWLSWHGDRRWHRVRCGRVGWSYWFGRGQRCKVLIWSSWRAYFDSVPLQKRDLMIYFNHLKPWGVLFHLVFFCHDFHNELSYFTTFLLLYDSPALSGMYRDVGLE